MQDVTKVQHRLVESETFSFNTWKTFKTTWSVRERSELANDGNYTWWWGHGPLRGCRLNTFLQIVPCKQKHLRLFGLLLENKRGLPQVLIGIWSRSLCFSVIRRRSRHRLRASSSASLHWSSVTPCWWWWGCSWSQSEMGWWGRWRQQVWWAWLWKREQQSIITFCLWFSTLRF